MLDEQYSTMFKLDIEEEKRKIQSTKKQPRKPLSPYIFFSQEKRKEIKRNNKVSAKAIMKQVSKCWQDIKNDKIRTEKYEYLSLRDREAYAILVRFIQENKNQRGISIDTDDIHLSLRSHDHHDPLHPISHDLTKESQLPVIQEAASNDSDQKDHQVGQPPENCNPE